MSKIDAFFNERVKKTTLRNTLTNFISQNVVKTVHGFHKTFPQYKPTPLHSLVKLAKLLQVNKIWVKDESYRFGLNAFKVLGGSYAIGNYLSKKIQKDISDLSFEILNSVELKGKIGQLTFVTATDGNHGRGVAWTARELGQKAVVFMPQGSSRYRIENIQRENADVIVTDFNYDKTVEMASDYAKSENFILIQDTAWRGYEEIPTWIMQGYSTIFNEIVEQLKNYGDSLPTHVFLQAGVGSFAASILGCLVSSYGDKRPTSIIIEPINAASLYKSAKIRDGKLHPVGGKLQTIMAGLACGVPNIIAWEILKEYADVFTMCPDYISAKGMRILGNPLTGDPPIISGESGAVGLGLLIELILNRSYSEIKNQLDLNSNSRILVFSTEGDTDPENYRKIVWEGKHPSI